MPIEKKITYSTADFIFLKNQIQEFFNLHLNDFKWPCLWLTPGEDLLAFYLFVNADRKNRQSWFKKAPFVLYWLFLKFKGNKNNLHNFIDWLSQNDEELYNLISKAWEEEDRIIFRYKKRRIFLPKSDEFPPFFQKIEKRFGNPIGDVFQLSSQTDIAPSELLKYGPEISRNFELVWRYALREAKILKRIFQFIKNRMINGNDWVKIRDLQIHLKMTRSKLKPFLKNLMFSRIIDWDQKNNTIRLKHDFNDEREFVWLGQLCYTRSPFEPRLEPGKQYKVKDFRSGVVDEWVRTGFAKFI